ncbi:MAG TPA: hypothetical protein VGJ61_12410 [Solirubrobacterales bacterium]
MKHRTRFHLGLGKAVASAEAEEETLELAAGEVGFTLEVGIGDQPPVKGTADRAPENRLAPH